MSDLYKSSDVVLMNNKYYISFTEKCSQPISLNTFEKHQLHDSEAQTDMEASEEMIRNASIEAERIINEAKTQAVDIIRQAMKQKEEEFADGFAKGIEKAEKQCHDKIKEINNNFQKTLCEKKEILEKTEQQVLNLSIKIAEKILHEKIQLSENRIKIYFENAIEDILRNDFEIINVRLNKYNIENYYPDWEVEKFMLNIKHDARLDNNSCILETETGDIDISVFAQLNEVSRKLINIA